MLNETDQLLRLGLAGGQWLFAAAGIYMLIKSLPHKSPRWRRMALLSWRTESPSERWMRLFRLRRDSSSFRERELLLASCGVTADAAWYVLARWTAIGLFVLLTLAACTWFGLNITSPAFQLAAGVPAILAGMLAVDRMWLRSFGRLRSLQVTKEIYTISRQLLYLSDSSLHIHAKLTRCVPFTKATRNDLESLLAEWYHDPAAALQRFKIRLGTDDGMSFVETLDALRFHESRDYYELLRIRIADYKDKLELAKESRKESSSYVLFLLAGIPILYTFQVFIFPWVKEGQKLFESLG
ncbi:hypothetical protein ACX1C1_01020 [Paenibacillus sp. strain BS8-2]